MRTERERKRHHIFFRYAEFNALKERNPELKTLVAVGGWSFGSGNFSAMAADHVMRSKFVTSAVAFLRQHGFDGLDLDWEYPGLRGGSASDRDNFVLLCKVRHTSSTTLSSVLSLFFWRFFLMGQIRFVLLVEN